MTFLNWVDLLMVVILAIGINSGRKSDFFTELIILCGVLFACVFSLHYYVRFGHFLNEQFVLPPGSQDVLGFILIAASIIGLTLLAKGGWLVIVKFNLNRQVDNWGSLTFSIIKSFFLCSLVFFALVISGQSSIEHFAKSSLSFKVFRKAPLWVYSNVYTGFIGYFFDEPINQKAFRVMKDSVRNERP